MVYKSLSDFVGQLTPKLSPLLQTLAKSGDADTFSRLSDALLTTFIMSKAQIAQLERRAAKAEARAPVIKLALQPAPTPVVQVR